MAEKVNEDSWIGEHRRELPEFKQPRFDLHKKKRSLEPDADLNTDRDISRDKDMVAASDSCSISDSLQRTCNAMRKVSMFPCTVDAYDFAPGDWVKEIISGQSATPYIGVVVSIHPKSNKVMVKWPHGLVQKDPEWLILVNKENALVMSRAAAKAANLVRVATGLRKRGYTDIETFLRLKKAFGQSEPMSWLAGAVEVAYPKKTASYSTNGELVRSFFRLAGYLNNVYADLDDSLKEDLWHS